VVYRDRAFSPRHLLSLVGGVKFPTGPHLAGVDEDSQPGSGSFDPFAGALYAWFSENVSLYASATYRYTTPGYQGYQRGQSVGASLGVQLQPVAPVGLGLSADFRWAAADSDASGAAAPDTGGASLALTPAIIVSPTSNWLIRLGAQLHLVDWLNGVQTDGPALVLSTVVDLN
jgi:hypothetical protein